MSKTFKAAETAEGHRIFGKCKTYSHAKALQMAWFGQAVARVLCAEGAETGARAQGLLRNALVTWRGSALSVRRLAAQHREKPSTTSWASQRRLIWDTISL